MPATYSRPRYDARQAGAVIIFNPGVTREQAQVALAKLADVLERIPEVQLFDPTHGGPVFYVP